MVDSEQHLSFVISAPGKVILHGEHSVVYGMTALAASLNLRTTIRFSNILDETSTKIELNLPCINLCRHFEVKELTCALFKEPIPLLKGVKQNEFNLETPEVINFKVLLARMKGFLLQHEGPTPLSLSQETALLSFFCLVAGMFASIKLSLQAFLMKVTTDLTIGAGMGSSASYGVCMSATLLHYIRTMCHNETGNISKKGFKSLKYHCSDPREFDKREKAIISHWAYLSDRIMHGKPSGIDNSICTYGSIIQFKKVQGAPRPEVKLIPDPKILKILLINTGISRNTARMVAIVSSARNKHLWIVEAVLKAMDEIALKVADILHRLGSASSDTVPTVEDELNMMGDLVDMNQHLLQALGVSHESLEHICRLVRGQGLHAKLTGAGGGGYAFLLLPPGPDQSRVDAAKALLEKNSYTFTEVQLGGPGVVLESQEEGATGPYHDKTDSIFSL